MIASGAYISIDSIVSSWLLKHSKTIHTYYKALLLAAEAVQELTLTSLPMVKHILLTKPQGQVWFELPPGFTDWCSVGIRQGNMWRPIGVSDRLMPMPDTCTNDAQFNPEHNDEFNINGNDWKSWLNRSCSNGIGSFFDGDFFGGDFDDTGNVPDLDAPCGCPSQYGYLFPYYWSSYPFFYSAMYNDWGELKGRFFGLGDGQRVDVCTFNKEKNIIMVPDAFPCNELYLVYVGIGKVDTMTHIDIRAQAAIEAYINWKYEANKRNGINNGKALKEEFNEQHRLLRARTNDLTPTTIHRIVMQYYGQTQRIG